VGRSWQAIVAGYVALFAIFIWVLGPATLWLGAAALRTLTPQRTGRGRAWFAVVVGTLSTLALSYEVASRLTHH
jgi:hypothetical protein